MDNIITENIKGFEIKLKLLPGVFSPRGLDNGTKLLIDNLEVRDGTVVADLGAGVGVLGLVITKLNRTCHVHLLEDHLRSYELARDNLELNNSRNVEVFLSNLFSAVPERTYNQIFSNPPAQMGNDFLEEVVAESFKHLKPEGYLWLVVPSHLKEVIERLFQKYFGNCKIMAHGKEHVVLKAKK